MIKLSTKGRYGLRALVDMAVHSDRDNLPLSGIAKRQEISIRYLEQVFSTLRKAGIVKSIKGAQGGYALSKKPSEISVEQILIALEGDLSIVDKTVDDNLNPLSIKYYLKINVWDKVNERISQLVKSMTLQDLADDYQKIQSNESQMFYI